MMMLVHSLLIVAVLLWPSCNGYSFFRGEIPNGYNVEHPCKPNTQWLGVGHLAEQGGGDRNPFGLAFHGNGKKWDRALCMMDSDGDGKTNGQELGDPGCVWVKGGAAPTVTTGITHPGFKTPSSSFPYNSSDPSTLDCYNAPSTGCPAKQDPAVKTLNLTMAPGTRVPAQETTLYCTGFKVPDAIPYHAIAFDAILDNRDVIHHMLLYGCTSNSLPAPGSCQMSALGCRDLVAVWALGLPDQCMPDVAGLRFGKGTYSSFQLQVHWNNPQLVSNHTDSSGMRIHYTPKLRLYDMGIMWLGEYNLWIPARTENTTVTSLCTSHCTQTLLEAPMYLTASLTHMHLTGRQSRIRHTSKATATTTLINFEDVYDYNTPKWTFHEPPLVVQPGDEMQLVCTWNTTERATNTTFGDATAQEMCFGFLQYYPKTGNLHCTTHTGYPICYSASTVCGDKCPLSIFFQNITNIFTEALAQCDASQSGPMGCSDGCRKNVEIIEAMRTSACLNTRHRTEIGAFWALATPYKTVLDSKVLHCKSIHADFGKVVLTNATFNTSAEVSASCPSDANVTRHPPSSTSSTQPTTLSNGATTPVPATTLVDDPSTATYIFPSFLTLSVLLISSLIF